MSESELRFPLYERAAEAGVLDGTSALIVAPTATGKSYLGRRVLYNACRKDPDAVHVYLVPFRALAAEMYDTVREELNGDGGNGGIRVRVATGDFTDPVKPAETDLLIATYERFAGILEREELRLGGLVADEFHLLDDPTRGPNVEGLFARILDRRRPDSLLALSAIIDNPGTLAEWLEVELVEGKPGDRAVEVEFRCDVVEDRDEALEACVSEVLGKGEQAIVFCSSRAGSEKAARELAGLLNGEAAAGADLLRETAEALAGEPDTDALVDLVPRGVGFHHAGLSRKARQALEAAFRGGALRVVACTPTLAAGVNLPAGLVVVRDIFRYDNVRGRSRYVVLSSGELLNMLGRAGRPGLAEAGTGLVLIEEKHQERPDVQAVEEAVQSGRGSPVRSRLPDSFDALLRFVLGVAVERGEVTRDEIGRVFRRTLWHHERPGDIEDVRSFEEDMMEDLPAWKRVRKSKKPIELAEVEASPDGLVGAVRSGKNRYDFHLGLADWSCSCPAARYRPWEVCKHTTAAIHELLFGEDVDREHHDLAVYTCLHQFTDTLDPGTKLHQAIRLLLDWRLLERVPGGLQATAAGTVASSSRFDVLLVRLAADRVAEMPADATIQDVARWTVEDFFGQEKEREKWLPAVAAWVRGEPAKSFKLPTRYRGDFERGVDDLARVAALYRDLAPGRSGREEAGELCEKARGSLRYGVPPRAVRLAALRFPGLGRRRCLALVDEHGIRDVEELAGADPGKLKMPGLGTEQAAAWVGRARTILGRRDAADEDDEGRDAAIDELVSEFGVEPLSLFPDLA